MAKSKYTSLSALVYSTDPNFKPGAAEQPEQVTPEPALQLLKLKLDKKHRAGKVVTLVTGFRGTEDDLQALGKQLKTHCGTGGSARDGEIIVQGDHLEKVLQWLIRNGYTKAKKQ